MGAIHELLDHIPVGGALDRPTLLRVAATLAAVFVVLHLFRSRRKAHNLPVVKVVDNKVVEALEEAHKKACLFVCCRRWLWRH